MSQSNQPNASADAPRLTVTANAAGQDQVLTPAALEFLAGMVARFTAERDRLLAERVKRQQAIDAGVTLPVCIH